MPVFNPSRLTLARRRRGITKSQLADDLQLSSRIITAYERGEKEPSSSTAARVADRLGFPVTFFHGPDLEEPPLDGASFRAMSRLTAGQRDQALGAGTLALALSDWIDERFTLPDPHVPRYEGVDPETAAEAVRAEWGLGQRTIPNMVHLLEAHGVRVFSLTDDCRQMDAFSFWRGEAPYTFLNTLKSGEHSRMDAAHELGHLVLHWRGGVHGRDAEHQAQSFGSAFLMPRGSLLAAAPRGARLTKVIQAKKRWKVSAAALVYRMHTVGLLTDWQYRKLFIEMGKKGYRVDEPSGIHGETSQILTKVLSELRHEGVGVRSMARDLSISQQELSKIMFGLVLVPV